MIDDKQQLINYINLLGVKTGEIFQLSSGESSNVYIDMKAVSLNGLVSKLLASLLYEEMKKYSPVTAVAGVALGGCHLASIVAMNSPFNAFDVMYIRKEAKNHGTKNLIEHPKMAINQEVALFEDVVTTGTSAINAAELITNAGFIVKGIIGVIDRRTNKVPYLGKYPFSALVNFEELSIK